MGLGARLLGASLAAAGGGMEGYLGHLDRMEQIRQNRMSGTREDRRIAAAEEANRLQGVEFGRRSLREKMEDKRRGDETYGYDAPDPNAPGGTRRILGSAERQGMETQAGLDREQRLGSQEGRIQQEWETRQQEQQRERSVREEAAAKEDGLVFAISEAAAKLDWKAVQAYARDKNITSKTSETYADWLRYDLPAWRKTGQEGDFGTVVGEEAAPAGPGRMIPLGADISIESSTPMAGGGGQPAPAFSGGQPLGSGYAIAGGPPSQSRPGQTEIDTVQRHPVTSGSMGIGPQTQQAISILVQKRRARDGTPIGSSQEALSWLQRNGADTSM
uniref:Uncharacterized protein n=1 Tax=viral metagenome TaxID=1070528 RepID=A0A6M3KAU2_9ZZZZ